MVELNAQKAWESNILWKMAIHYDHLMLKRELYRKVTDIFLFPNYL